ncbi:LysE family translocator [Xanthomonas translucens]|uniref:LysE family translocator n=1 Tax=Xanthomonas campestris pv. translucens TaxID=343 RepID=UPI000839F520|nr:LysE family translocator [Xanthomonas translucens]
MSLHVWWMFLLTVFVLSGTPGPNMLHVMTRSVRFGVRRSLLAMAGCLLALVLVLLASAAGLGAVLDASPRVFEVLRYAGVGYLLWLGIAAWRSGEAPLDPQGAPPLAASLSPLQLFRGGLAIGLSNPKLLLFAAAFLPQFVDKSQPRWPQFAILVATFAACELFWYALYGIGGHGIRRYLSRPGLRRLFDRVVGTLFIGFGIVLLRFRPQ